jgi:hypothetical protein
VPQNALEYMKKHPPREYILADDRRMPHISLVSGAPGLPPAPPTPPAPIPLAYLPGAAPYDDRRRPPGA